MTLDMLTQLVARILDYPLGWLLKMPRDLMIVLIALATSLMMNLARKWTTNQELLHRCDNDQKRLKVLAKTAKAAKDKLALQRNRATMAMIQLMQFKAEMRSMMFSIVPVALLATWAFVRVPYVAPAVNQPLVVKAYYPLSCVDRLTHLLPVAGLEVPDPIQIIHPDPTGPNALATWTITATIPLPHADLCFRYGEETVHHPCAIGGAIYEPPVVEHPGSTILVTETVLKQPKVFGILPAVPVNPLKWTLPWSKPAGAEPLPTGGQMPDDATSSFSIDSWLVAYIVLAFIFVPLSRSVLKVY